MIVYKATNTVNGKGYIGITCQDLRDRITQHKCRAENGRTAFACALSKYGFDAFTWDVLAVCESRQELEAEEVRLIAIHRTHVDLDGYNRTVGGAGTGGLRPSEATRALLSEAARRRKISDATRKKLSENAKAQDLSKFLGCRKGVKRTKESIEKWRASMVGVKPAPRSESAKRNIREAIRKRVENGVGYKLRPTDRVDIAARRSRGETFKAIGAIYGVRPETVFYFCKRHEVST